MLDQEIKVRPTVSGNIGFCFGLRDVPPILANDYPQLDCGKSAIRVASSLGTIC